MTKEELDELAQRPTCCKPFGETVTISRAERDALVALARTAIDACRGLSQMYSATWDSVNGDLLMLAPSIPRFEAAHRKAIDFLNEFDGKPPLYYGDEDD